MGWEGRGGAWSVGAMGSVYHAKDEMAEWAAGVQGGRGRSGKVRVGIRGGTSCNMPLMDQHVPPDEMDHSGPRTNASTKFGTRAQRGHTGYVQMCSCIHVLLPLAHLPRTCMCTCIARAPEELQLPGLACEAIRLRVAWDALVTHYGHWVQVLGGGGLWVRGWVLWGGYGG